MRFTDKVCQNHLEPNMDTLLDGMELGGGDSSFLLLHFWHLINNTRAAVLIVLGGQDSNIKTKLDLLPT